VAGNIASECWVTIRSNSGYLGRAARQLKFSLRFTHLMTGPNVSPWFHIFCGCAEPEQLNHFTGAGYSGPKVPDLTGSSIATSAAALCFHPGGSWPSGAEDWKV
jgi:hypothetical protein